MKQKTTGLLSLIIMLVMLVNVMPIGAVSVAADSNAVVLENGVYSGDGTYLEQAAEEAYAPGEAVAVDANSFESAEPIVPVALTEELQIGEGSYEPNAISEFDATTDLTENSGVIFGGTDLNFGTYYTVSGSSVSSSTSQPSGGFVYVACRNNECYIYIYNITYNCTGGDPFRAYDGNKEAIIAVTNSQWRVQNDLEIVILGENTFKVSSDIVSSGTSGDACIIGVCKPNTGKTVTISGTGKLTTFTGNSTSDTSTKHANGIRASRPMTIQDSVQLDVTVCSTTGGMDVHGIYAEGGDLTIQGSAKVNVTTGSNPSGTYADGLRASENISIGGTAKVNVKIGSANVEPFAIIADKGITVGASAAVTAESSAANGSNGKSYAMKAWNGTITINGRVELYGVNAAANGSSYSFGGPTSVKAGTSKASATAITSGYTTALSSKPYFSNATQEYEIYIEGVQLSSDYSTGNGWSLSVSGDAYTLNLNGYTNDADTGGDRDGIISASVPLTINLTGTNTVTTSALKQSIIVNNNLTITGSGVLEAICNTGTGMANSMGIYCSHAISITGSATVISKGGAHSNSFGIIGEKGVSVGSNCHVEFSGNGQAGRANNGSVASATFTCARSSVADKSIVIAANGTSADTLLNYKHFVTGTGYRVWLAGRRFY